MGRKKSQFIQHSYNYFVQIVLSSFGFVAVDAGAIGKKVEQVGSAFADFKDKVEDALQAIESSMPTIGTLLQSNAFLLKTLPLTEVRVAEARESPAGLQQLRSELDLQVKPHAEALTRALENLRETLPNSAVLDLPSEKTSRSVGDLADDNLAQFYNIYHEVCFRLVRLVKGLSAVDLPWQLLYFIDGIVN